MTKLSTCEMPVFGAERAPTLNQRTALRAVGQRLLVVLSTGPGPLVEQDESHALPVAPTPVFDKPVAVVVSIDAMGQKDSGAAAVGARFDAEPVCQHGVDVKAFTGKGTPRAVRLATKAVDDIHARMRNLALDSVKLGKKVLYLTVHMRSQTNQHSLRWRGYVVVGGRGVYKHLTWDEAAQRIEQQPYALQVQLQLWNAQARDLNQAEQVARTELKRVR
ncbi:MAG: hypothetical protein JF606_29165 [Burkholderiales bacterium]|nr:hypothetical protein [Burkholderiales bacterium]